jgi:hypothetical protein
MQMALEWISVQFLLLSKVPEHMKWFRLCLLMKLGKLCFPLGVTRHLDQMAFVLVFTIRTGLLLVMMLLQLFSTSSLIDVCLGGWNATAFTLVPKLSCPLTMKDYRPIASCNVVFKCISKILALRLQPIIPFLIDQSQAGQGQGSL